MPGRLPSWTGPILCRIRRLLLDWRAVSVVQSSFSLHKALSAQKYAWALPLNGTSNSPQYGAAVLGRFFTTDTDTTDTGMNHKDDEINVAVAQNLANLTERLHEPKFQRLHTANALQHGSYHGGTVRKRELAFSVCSAYGSLPTIKLADTSNKCQRSQILMYLAVNCYPDSKTIRDVVSRYSAREDMHEHMHDVQNALSLSTPIDAAVDLLRSATTPKYERLFNFMLEQHPLKAMPFFVTLRYDLLQLLAFSRLPHCDVEIQKATAHLKELDAYLKRLLKTWFGPGMLEIKRITYQDTPASIIERIATKEAVHPLRNLDDLRRRLGHNRRVFALFHPLLPNEPLVFVHVSLQPDIPSTMKQILDDTDVEQVGREGDHALPRKVAAFYSISNSQPGLAGVGLGEFLLKESIKMLQREFPSTLDTFVTLSPMPNFRRWLQTKVEASAYGDHNAFADDSLLTKGDIRNLGASSKHEALAKLMQKLENDDDTADEAVRDIALRLGLRYLVLEKHRREPLDKVARFHVGNGAEFYRINGIGADPSRNGRRNSFGMMVNYLYRCDQVASNQLAYEQDFTVPVSSIVTELLPRIGSSKL